MPNRLARETSPYLLQHCDNPVDWYPWGSEALERALELDRPILLSVGYSACHWCHVMERESFEDEATAAYMNEHFVCVKVDREERPDVDALYMEAVQAISGQGGWPMTVFCDPEGVPFYGGTYFPPDESRGMPSFRMVMEAVLDAFENQREELRERAPETRRRLGAIGAVEPAGERPGAELLEGATATLRENADMQRGGFGGAPKFPPAATLELLLARGVREPVERTLDAMLAGGIYDQLGGGFARYAVDASWLVPHFEKMLYDNAQLARAYLHGWQAFGHGRYRRIVEETLDWALREMRGPEGGFYSALDADSEGEEGRFYVWTPDELRDVLGGERAEAIGAYYGVSDAGNFEGRSILHLAGGAEAPAPDGLAEARRELYEARARRVRPGLDDKRLAAWNALMLGALAEAGAALGRDDYLDAARECAEFVLDRMRTDVFAEGVAMAKQTANAPPAAHLQGRGSAAQRLPRGPRLPAGSAADAVRSYFRAALVRGGTGARRDDDRALRRRRARWLLFDLRRPRAADRAAQGDRRPPDPLRQLCRGARPAAARGSDRRAPLRRVGGRRAAPLRQGGYAPPRRLRPPAARPRLRPRSHQGGGADRRRPDRVDRGRPLRVPPVPRPRRRTARQRLPASAP